MTEERILNCKIHIDEDGRCELNVLEPLKNAEIEKLRIAFQGTQRSDVVLNDGPIGPMPQPCKIIILGCERIGESR